MMIKVNKRFHFTTSLVLGALMLVATLPAVALANGAEGPQKPADFVTTVALTQTHPGTVTKSLSFVDTNGDGVPEDLNKNGTLGEPGLAPSGDQTIRIDRVGQVFKGTINEVTAVTKKGAKVASKLAAASKTITFNSTIFLGPQIAPGVHAIFGQASGTSVITEKNGKGELTVSYTASLTGTLNLATGAVAVSDTGDFQAVNAKEGFNGVKGIHGNFGALAKGLVGAESAVVTLSGTAK